ncbi:hypothetical protein KKD03_02310 [Patescibacteria group bacterium]|nr:hypothetical protein [Patescibacteria group bacterium]
MKKLLVSFILIFLTLLQSAGCVQAFDTSKLGVHILSIYELDDAKKLVTLADDVLGTNTEVKIGVGTEKNTELVPQANFDYQNWNYVTIPLTLDDVKSNKELEWQLFFDNAKRLKLIPIVRLTTEYAPESSFWLVPNRKQIIEQINFLSKLSWPTKKKHIIVYNEVNHASEWGGRVDPEGYSNVLKFASSWAHTEETNFVVLPAAMDLVAPNGKSTLEAFNYLNQMYDLDPEVFSYIDVWNSHSYPNPGFIGSPTSYGKTSMRGFQYELNFLKYKTGKDYQVMITETGWKATLANSRWLESYYTYSMQHIWSDDRVIAVTPFLLKGSPGPFSNFSFYDENEQPTAQYSAYQNAIKKIDS